MRPDWKSIDTAPKDGTWVKVRGWDFGVPGNKRHYAIAFFENADWNEVGSDGCLLYYLTDWHPLSPQASEAPHG
jgi:hypothetical protein